ncbi:MAG: CARDB domain-containing protein, partial [Candidatus Poribacteria bacterium]|nr:CARDB domain-containing protein [Candidatus Poribacteria bacterium]
MRPWPILLSLPLLSISLSITSLAQLPDFEISAQSITFSDLSPVEGQEISIFIDIKNVGDGAPTPNEDLLLNLYEGPPEADPILIMCRQVIIGLEPGQSKRFTARWRVPPGDTEIHAVANPTDNKKHISESNLKNNYAFTSITAGNRSFPAATEEQIRTAIQRGVDWVKSQQGRHSRTCLQCGTENQLILSCVICGATLKGLPVDQQPGPAWDFGEESRQETAIALLALISSGRAIGHSLLEDPVVR